MITSGIREYIKYLVQHRMVQVLVTSAGGIEEDFIKCVAPTVRGDFELSGKGLRKQGLNRVGNMIIANDNYCKFEEWVMEVINKMQDESEADPSLNWTPSKIIHRLGKEINHEDSVYYWAYKNNIPVFCPAITDGSLGDMLFFHSYKRPGFRIDLVEDVRLLNDQAVKARKTGCIVLGGGTPKHHVMNANLMRNGTDFCVYVNTGNHFDASDSGASCDEAVSWGKTKVWAAPVKIHADATLVFPWMVARCFAERQKQADRRSATWREASAIFDKQLTPMEREEERAKTLGSQ
jgi:deoxyhypusine synthase